MQEPGGSDEGCLSYRIARRARLSPGRVAASVRLSATGGTTAWLPMIAWLGKTSFGSSLDWLRDAWNLPAAATS